ncbi:MAG: ribonuclease III [Candidatus Pacebacteria bacterium]|nr:ribonuclease III [Candidatus Paceibacterota bacterium]
MKGPNFKKIEKIIGVQFKNIDLLKQALTHRSFLNEHPEWLDIGHNEKLEFLGDAVIGLITAEYLYKKYPQLQEGELTSLRAALINGNSLLEAAAETGIQDYLLVSKGEKKELKKHQPYFLANAIEALVGAIYLDQGYTEAEKFAKKYLLVKADKIFKTKSFRDPKSIFQEKSQEILSITPTYKLIKSWGPDHAKQFEIGVYLKDKLIAQGEGCSKQEAEVQAAEKALLKKEWQEKAKK